VILTASLFQYLVEMGFSDCPFEYRVVNCDLCYQFLSVSHKKKLYFSNSKNYKRELIKMFASYYYNSFTLIYGNTPV
jgi:hypothetical protein